MRFSLPAVALGAAMLGATSGAQAQLDQELVYGNNIGFVCTGLAEETRGDPRWQRYPLKLVFSEPSGLYLADVQVSIRQGGTTIFQGKCPSPWMLVNLPAGTYQVTGRLESGPSRDSTVTVQSGRQSQISMQFPPGA